MWWDKDPSKTNLWATVSTNDFDSKLEIPNGKDPNQNAWLTLTVRYALNFLDSRSSSGDVIVRKDGKCYAKDSDGTLFPVLDWDFKSQQTFNKRFLKGENIWNHKFLLLTPRDYSKLDFTSFAGSGWVCRPNVLCLFRLESYAAKAHRTISVVRVESKSFRSNAVLYKEGDVLTKTLGHELGHALSMLHIQALKGNQACVVSPNDDPCYDGDTPEENENIAAHGDKLSTLNAITWQECMGAHTETAHTSWHSTMAVSTPPRKMPLGFQVRNVMPARF